MKTRKLKAWIEWTLIAIASTLFIFLAMIDSFDLAVAPYIILMWVIVITIILILRKYGKGRIYEDVKRY